MKRKIRSSQRYISWLTLSLLLILTLVLGACGASNTQSSSTERLSNVKIPPPSSTKLPRPDHVVVVIEENRSFQDIIGSSEAPYINALARQGALFNNYFALTHPSQPNYLALFSGSTQGVTSDVCPNTFSSPNLGNSLIKAGLGFAGYSEDMPSVGYTGCFYPASTQLYARKHNPWVNFTNIAASANQPYTSFPSNYSKLPTLSFVIPNQDNDMHSASISRGDSWLKQHIDSYAQWAKAHNSLLIVTWDEDDYSRNNQIPTLFVGSMVRTGTYNEKLTHYNLLRTLEAMYNLPYVSNSANALPITDTWAG